MENKTSESHISVIGTPINKLTWSSVITTISKWAKLNESKYICICNVHSVVTAAQDNHFHTILREADMATPDGAPVAWYMKAVGGGHQQRINGPDLMWKYLTHINNGNESIYLYGGKQSTLDILQKKICEHFPNVRIAGSYSPPFRNLTDTEQQKIVEMINNSGANTIWVSLGCPKQETWMHQQKGKINGVMIGVGAAFDYHAGTLKRAPEWMQNNGLEWFYRLCQEPSRLWKRYLVTNTLFVFLSIKSILQKTLTR